MTDFDSLMAAVDPPLIVLTTAVEGESGGCLVGFHAQSSIEPHQYCVWLSKANNTYRLALRAEHFAVHFLGEGDLSWAERFGTVSGEDVDKFADVDVTLSPDGVPLIDGLSNRMLLDRIALLDSGGDHVCLCLDVRDVQGDGDLVPLRVSAADHLEPGRDAEERAIDPA